MGWSPRRDSTTLDGRALGYRAIYALALGLATSSGKVTNAVSGNDSNALEIAQVSVVGYGVDDVIATTTSSMNQRELGSPGEVVI